MADQTLERRDPRTLKNHPLNIRLYGDAPDQEFVAKVKQHGIKEPLLILPDSTVVSGHRRRQAAIINKIAEVPVIVLRNLTDPLEIEEQIIVCNEQRVKTTEQRAREYEHLKTIEAERAKKRQAHGQTAPGKRLGANYPKRSDSTKQGKSSELAAEKVGLSTRTAERAAAVVKEIDRAEAEGEPERAQELRQTLNEKSVAAAHRQVEDDKPAAGNGKPRKKEHEGATLLKAAEKALGAMQGHVENATRQIPDDRKTAIVSRFDEACKQAHAAIQKLKGLCK